MKLKLKPEITAPVEVSIGNFTQRFEPSVEVEIESLKFAAYLAAQDFIEVVGEGAGRATKKSRATEE